MTSSSILLQQLPLCKYCTQREGLKTSGKRQLDVSCFLCEGTLEGLSSICEEILEKLADYEFETFLIGASIPQNMLDKEDELRSKLKIKGVEGIKSQITRVLSKKVASTLKKRVDYTRPDITVLVSLRDNIISITPRSLWISANYVKQIRGIPQRSTVCEICSGLGCAQCNYVGKSVNSVQGIITAFLLKVFQAESCNFVWLGSEDENSLVKGSGRPFYSEIVKPKKRKMPAPFLRSKTKAGKNRRTYNLDGVKISGIEILDKKVTNVPQFEIVAEIHLQAKTDAEVLNQEQVRTIESNFSNRWASVRLSRKMRTVQKRLESVKVKTSEDGKSLVLLVKCDGGIPLRKLVNGRDNSVEPNLSAFLSSYEINNADPFDILAVKIKQLDYGSVNRPLNEALDSELPEADNLELQT